MYTKITATMWVIGSAGLTLTMPTSVVPFWLFAVCTLSGVTNVLCLIWRKPPQARKVEQLTTLNLMLDLVSTQAVVRIKELEAQLGIGNKR